MGCLLVLLGGVFPRLALLIVWLARPVLVNEAFGNALFIPVLGIIFLPFATLVYVLLYRPGLGVTGFDWFWIILAGFFDLAHWMSSGYTQRRRASGVY